MIKKRIKTYYNLLKNLYSVGALEYTDIKHKVNQIDNKIDTIEFNHYFEKDLMEKVKYKFIREERVKEINILAEKKLNDVYNLDNVFLKKLSLNEDDNIPLSEEEQKQINDFWEPYKFAYQNNPNIQWAYSRMSGKFDPSYIGWGLQFILLRNFWEFKLIRTLSLKHWTAWFLKDLIPTPETYVICEWGGKCYDNNRKRLTTEEAINVLFNVSNTGKNILLKPSDGVCGQGIHVIKAYSTRDDLMKIFKTYKDRFICQEFIRNHPSYSTGSSLNTLRIVTFLYKDEVHWVGTMLRMGVGGVVDNWHAGGISCPVNKDGICGNFAVPLSGKRYYKHPNNFNFAGKKLFNYEVAHNLAIELHKKIPFVKYIAWDIAIDEKGEPIVLEFGNPGHSGIMAAGGFNIYLNKEVVKEILDEYLIRRFFYLKAVFDWDYKEFKNNIALIRYCGFDKIVKIPETIEGKKITLLSNGAIRNSAIEEIYIPKNIKIEPNAILVKNAKVIKY